MTPLLILHNICFVQFVLALLLHRLLQSFTMDSWKIANVSQCTEKLKYLNIFNKYVFDPSKLPGSTMHHHHHHNHIHPAANDYTPIYWVFGLLTVSLIATVIFNRCISKPSSNSSYEEIPGDTLDHGLLQTTETSQGDPIVQNAAYCAFQRPICEFIQEKNIQI